MTRKMGSDYDIKLKFFTNVYNRQILKVRKFHSYISYEKKVIEKHMTGGGRNPHPPPPPPLHPHPPRLNRIKPKI